MRRFPFIIGVVLAVAALSGCDGDPEPDLCQDLDEGCQEDGVRRCNRDNDAIESCQPNADGCLVWIEEEFCGDPGTCATEDSVPECRCDNECEATTESRCRGDVIQRCTEDAEGCLYWAEATDCAEEGQICDDLARPAECVSDCGNECSPEDGLRCFGVLIEECVADEEGCFDWQVETDCGERSQTCDDTSGTPECARTCSDQCDSVGLVECHGDEVATCQLNAESCLTWIVDIDCSAEDLICVEDGGEADCACPEVCADGESRCSGDAVERCAVMTNDCWGWEEEVDCVDLGLSCVETDGEASCTNGSGDACDDAMALWDLPATLSGDDFSADFTDDQMFTGDGCVAGSASPEAVFMVEVEAEGSIYMMERGDVDVVFSVQSACGAAEGCLLSSGDLGDGLLFEPDTAGRYWIIVETNGAASAGQSYEINIDVTYPELCDDGVDNDHDFLVDCLDPDCFGDATHCGVEVDCGDGADNDDDGAVDCADDDCFGDADNCAAELLCDDGLDNDGDGDTDCDDPDCSVIAPCAPFRGYWEQFETDDAPDLDSRTITFTADDADPEGYTWAIERLTESNFPDRPGDGTTSTPLTLGDNEASELVYTTFGGFPFYGTTYTSVFVSSNGYVTFDAMAVSSSPTPEDHFAHPAVAGLHLDLDPSSAGEITVDEYADRVTISFVAVPSATAAVPADEPNTFQIVLYDDGTVVLHYLDISVIDTIVGISNGDGDGSFPAETDFLP